VRDSVGFRFFESWSEEEELAPLVLEACRRYGEEATLNLLSFGCRFPLSTDGLLDALRSLTESRPPFVEQWVSLAPLSLVNGRTELLRSVLSPRAVARLLRRGRFQRETTTELWRRLDALCRKLGSTAVAPGERDEVDDLLEALGASEDRRSVAEGVLALEETAVHLRWTLVELAGAMKLSELTEPLVGLLGSADERVARASVEALARIGSPVIASSIASRYGASSRGFRRFALSVLKANPHDSSEELLSKLAETEAHPALRARVFDALRFRFTERSESLLRRELERSTSLAIVDEIAKALFVIEALRGRESQAPPPEGDVRFRIPFAWEGE
jgi:HEAT repeat protein